MKVKNEIIRSKLEILLDFFNLTKKELMKILKVEENFNIYDFTKISGIQIIDLSNELNISCNVLEEIFSLDDFDETRLSKKLNGFKGYGVKRKVDELGRVVLPKEMRETLNVKDYDFMNISISKEGFFIVKPINSRCSCCGRNKDLKTINNVSLCSKCISKFKGE